MTGTYGAMWVICFIKNFSAKTKNAERAAKVREYFVKNYSSWKITKSAKNFQLILYLFSTFKLITSVFHEPDAVC